MQDNRFSKEAIGWFGGSGYDTIPVGTSASVVFSVMSMQNTEKLEYYEKGYLTSIHNMYTI